MPHSFWRGTASFCSVECRVGSQCIKCLIRFDMLIPSNWMKRLFEICWVNKWHLPIYWDWIHKQCLSLKFQWNVGRTRYIITNGLCFMARYCPRPYVKSTQMLFESKMKVKCEMNQLRHNHSWIRFAQIYVSVKSMLSQSHPSIWILQCPLHQKVKFESYNLFVCHTLATFYSSIALLCFAYTYE